MSCSKIRPMNPLQNTRETRSGVNHLFTERWSPRSFDPNFELSSDDLDTIMEAARWAPSSFNEQPWTIHLAKRGRPAFDQLLQTLTESNQIWAKNASVLCFMVGRRFFSRNQKENTTFEFDCGAAWMSLTLQTRMLGLYTHGMVGFNREQAGKLLKVDPDKEKVIAAFTIGKRDEPSKLPEKLREMEKMNQRKDLSEVYVIHEKKSSYSD